MMTSPRDDDATLARVYAELADRAGEWEDAASIRSVADRLALVRRYRPRPGRLLDVGCGAGLFVGAAHRAGWEATGIDASARAVARAEGRCPHAGFRAGLVTEIDFPGGSFDVITLWDVLEHVAGPVEALERIRGWLAPDGWLFLSMPNVDSRIARLMGRHWVLLLREHLWYFSPATIAAVLSRGGFVRAHVRSKLVPFTVAGLLGRLAQYPGGAGRVAARLAGVEAFRHLVLRVPIGEMYVVARPSAGRRETCAR
jgi:2-polyprenyl-3-methyl-5-hydroxy-6-metoxy-1,4-benzoquinol methylase